VTYALSNDYWDERHYESIGHKRRIEFSPRGDVRWKCGCGAVGAWSGSQARVRAAFARHVDRALSHG
jgi:hypothetical protein